MSLQPHAENRPELLLAADSQGSGVLKPNSNQAAFSLNNHYGFQSGDGLRALAGLHGDDPHDVRDLLPAALAEAGVVLPEPGSDAAKVSFRKASIEVVYRWVAETFLAGRAGPRWVVDKVCEFVSNNDYDDASMAGLMGALWQIDDEWDMGRGRGNDALVRDITAACEAQVNR